MAEIYKVVPEILRCFEISMPQEREWKTHNASFNLTSGVVCDIKRRNTWSATDEDEGGMQQERA